MTALVWLLVLGTSIWMYADASQHNYDPRDIRGLAAMSPIGWLFAGLLLWIVAFPMYLVKRGELKAAGERRKRMLASQGSYALRPPPMPAQVPYAAGPPVNYGVPPSPPAPSRSSLDLDEVEQGLRKLAELRDKGLLTEAEFAQQKAQLLARM